MKEGKGSLGTDPEVREKRCRLDRGPEKRGGEGKEGEGRGGEEQKQRAFNCLE